MAPLERTAILEGCWHVPGVLVQTYPFLEQQWAAPAATTHPLTPVNNSPKLPVAETAAGMDPGSPEV